MGWLHRSMEVDVPARAAYDAFTRPERLQELVEGVKEVRPVGRRHLHWRALVGGHEREWTSRITARERGRRFAWGSEAVPHGAGAIVFEPAAPGHARMTLWLEDTTHGIAEKAPRAVTDVAAVEAREPEPPEPGRR